MGNVNYKQTYKVENGVLVEAKPSLMREFVIPKEVKSINLNNKKEFNSKVEKITCEPGSQLEVINENTFENMLYIKQIDLSNCLNLKTIDKDAVSYCPSLRSVEFPKSIETINENFRYCPRLAISNLEKLKDLKTIDCSSLLEFNEYLQQTHSQTYNLEPLMDKIKLNSSVTNTLTVKDLPFIYNLMNNGLNEDIKTDFSNNDNKENKPFLYLRFNFEDIIKGELKSLKKTIKFSKENNLPIKFIIFNDRNLENVNEGKVNYIYDKKELIKLNKLNNYIKRKTGEELYLQELGQHNWAIEDENCWSFSKVVKANSIFKDIANDIKKAGLTPLEALTYIHNYCAGFNYNDNKKAMSEQVRNVVGILNSDNPNIVCTGYASLEKAIIDELNMPGLKCRINTCSMDDKDETLTALHANNEIIIEDEKYNVKGTYFDDPCWDSKNDKENKPETFSFCIYSLEDLMSMKKNYYNMDIKTKEEFINGVFIFSQSLSSLHDFYIQTAAYKVLYKLKNRNYNDIIKPMYKLLNSSKVKNKDDVLKIEILIKAINFMKDPDQNVKTLKELIPKDKEAFEEKINNIYKEMINESEFLRSSYFKTEEQRKFHSKPHTDVPLNKIFEAYSNACNKLNIKDEKLNNKIEKSKEKATELFNESSSRGAKDLSPDHYKKLIDDIVEKVVQGIDNQYQNNNEMSM